MQTKTELARTVAGIERNPACDEAIKQLFSAKYLLAWIMKGCVAEYRDCSLENIAERYNGMFQRSIQYGYAGK